VKILLCMMILLIPCGAFAEDLQASAQALIASLELEALGEAVTESGWFGEGVAQLLASWQEDSPSSAHRRRLSFSSVKRLACFKTACGGCRA